MKTSESIKRKTIPEAISSTGASKSIPVIQDVYLKLKEAVEIEKHQYGFSSDHVSCECPHYGDPRIHIWMGIMEAEHVLTRLEATMHTELVDRPYRSGDYTEYARELRNLQYLVSEGNAIVRKVKLNSSKP